MTEKDQSKTPERILVIAAHPDDIEFGAAGSIAKWTDEGATVTYCLVTDGAAGNNDPGTDLEALVETRRKEQLASAKIVGVEDVRFLGYADGTLQPTLEVRCKLTRIIRELKPDRVVCQDPTTVFFQSFYINHPDHRAAGEAAIYAVFPSAGTRPIFPELLGEGLEPHNVKELYLTLTTEPTEAVDISTTFKRKIESLLCHSSQIGEEAADRIREWNSEAGEPHGFEYAEHFRVMRFGSWGEDEEGDEAS